MYNEMFEHKYPYELSLPSVMLQGFDAYVDAMARGNVLPRTQSTFAREEKPKNVVRGTDREAEMVKLVLGIDLIEVDSVVADARNVM